MPHIGEFLRSANLTRAQTKTTPADADSFYGTDSEVSNTIKRFTWANIKAALFASPVHQIATSEPSPTVAGMVVYADGSSWDPGSGEGLYRRNVANSAWVFLG